MSLPEELKKAYQEQKKKYVSLPDYETLNKEFELEDYFQDRKYVSRFLLRQIRRRLADYLFFWANLIHNSLAPPPNSMILTREYQELSEDQKQKLFQVVQKIMLQSRTSLQFELEKEDKKDAEYIQKAYKTMKEIHPELKQYVAQLIKCWEKESKTSPKDRNY